ncbi:UDP-N-acetylmuramate dehydrogenase [Marinomonas piezotolerans]|uniref:UDP-N-acetylenolpyruvoylglucosamine reductase n=1 Tax=Marinomonas piezotolerans TaxID=2213058 RepID=A0A370UDM8_9GAMM|nr:UDP-N-acetylmuramate dehydrogenase [Marinomonas piezotolerans]RDL45896.1 UDP-N-acetylmuramate dehydrogenase [Marinomonas piezotolerans]
MNEASLPFSIRSNVDLKPYNTFHFAYKARYLVEVCDIDHLVQVLTWADANQLNTHVFGGGSNLLICSDLSGLVVINRMLGIQVLHESDLSAVVRFSGGEVWHHCVEWAVKQNYSGIENLALIPGTAGAAPVQNIGAYGVEIVDTLKAVKVIDRFSLEIKDISAEECGFGYRESHFKGDWSGRYIILSIDLELSKSASPKLSYGGLGKVLSNSASLRDVFEHVCEIRQSKLPDPNVVGNAGSYFKNPLIDDQQHSSLKETYPELVSFKVGERWKVAAGWLNEHAGWKGIRSGGVGVYDKQALVLVNYTDDNAEGLLFLEQNIKNSIYSLFGITLEREPVLIGTNISA